MVCLNSFIIQQIRIFHTQFNAHDHSMFDGFDRRVSGQLLRQSIQPDKRNTGNDFPRHGVTMSHFLRYEGWVQLHCGLFQRSG